MFNVMIGYETRLPLQYMVAARSLAEKVSHAVNISPILLPDLIAQGLYYRPMSKVNGNLSDHISGAPMSTEFAISRFFIPLLNKYQGWTLFCDSDFLFRDDVLKLMELAHPKYAVMCVKHQYEPIEATKMDGQAQTRYRRKNWSSLMLINNAHPMNKQLNLQKLNASPGRDLHAFDWLMDEEIGALPEEWNWLEGHSSGDIDPKAVHFTRGTPDMDGHADVPYADEWQKLAAEMSIYANGQS